MAVYVSPTIGGAKVGETKRKIIESSIILFSDKNYSAVTTRDITKAADISPATLYCHFASKDDILRMIYFLFEEYLERSRPDIGDLMDEARSAPPRDVLMRANVQFDAQYRETMDRIVTIAAAECSRDAMSEAFIKKNLIDGVWEQMRLLVDKLVELGRIEPLDVGAFLTLHTNFSYAVVLRSCTSFPVEIDYWRSGIGLLHELIKPTGR